MTFFPTYFFAVVYSEEWMASPLKSSCNSKSASRAPAKDVTGRKDLLGERGDVQRASPESQGKYDVGWAKNAFDIGPIGEYPTYVDDPRSRGVLCGACHGRRGPDV